MTVTRRSKDLIRRIQQSLTPDLLRGQWKRTQSSPLEGHCYVAAESLWHMIGGKASRYIPHVLTHKLWPEGLDQGETHWFLRKGKAILDPTARQFPAPPKYDSGKPCGFLTKEPSRRARIVIERAKRLK